VNLPIRAAALVFVSYCCLPVLAAAQGSPVADAFRANEKRVATNLMAAADEVPAEKYSYKPTPAQMSIGEIVAHLAEGNDFFCGAIGGTKAPTRAKFAGTDSKDQLVAVLKASFAFCDQALASLDDTKLGEQLPSFGGKTMARASLMTAATGDWADHYSQMAIYLRLNGMLPPTAKKPTM